MLAQKDITKKLIELNNSLVDKPRSKVRFIREYVRIFGTNTSFIQVLVDEYNILDTSPTSFTNYIGASLVKILVGEIDIIKDYNRLVPNKICKHCGK